MLQQVWTSTQVASAPTPASVSIGERRGVEIMNRSKYWLVATSGPLQLAIVPAWFTSRFTVPPPRRNFILSVYQSNGSNVTDPDITTLAHGVWVDADHYVEHEGQEPISGNQMALTGSAVTQVTLLNAATATGAGAAQPVDGNKSLTVEAYGTSTSFSLQIQGVSTSGTAYALNTVNTGSMTNATTITAAGIYSVDVTGLVSVKADLTAIGNGNVSVAGELVS